MAPTTHDRLTHTAADLPVRLAAAFGNRLDDVAFSGPAEEGELWFGRDRVVVELADIGEGLGGDFDPDDPEDVPLLRFTFLVQNLEGEWDAMDDCSYCTSIDARTPWEARLGLAAHLFHQMELHLRPDAGEDTDPGWGRSARRWAEDLSPLSEDHEAATGLAELARALRTEEALDASLPAPAVTPSRGPRM